LPSAIETDALTKGFDDQVVLAGIDFSITAGGVSALLGPNDAGKTTAVHILSTLLRSAPHRGHRTVLRG
jgi:ABC-2 type transport system ATP-binding protein